MSWDKFIEDVEIDILHLTTNKVFVSDAAGTRWEPVAKEVSIAGPLAKSDSEIQKLHDLCVSNRVTYTSQKLFGERAKYTIHLGDRSENQDHTK